MIEKHDLRFCSYAKLCCEVCKDVKNLKVGKNWNDREALRQSQRL